MARAMDQRQRRAWESTNASVTQAGSKTVRSAPERERARERERENETFGVLARSVGIAALEVRAIRHYKRAW